MATKINPNPNFESLKPLLFKIQSFTNPQKAYIVNLMEPTCTCPHFQFRGVRCKHIATIENHLDQTRYWK